MAEGLSPEIENFIKTGQTPEQEQKKQASQSRQSKPAAKKTPTRHLQPVAKEPDSKEAQKAQELAQSITVSLHSQDLKRLDEIEAELEKQGLLQRNGRRRRLSTSALVRIAIAGFAPENAPLNDLLESATRR